MRRPIYNRAWHLPCPYNIAADGLTGFVEFESDGYCTCLLCFNTAILRAIDRKASSSCLDSVTWM